MPDRLPPLTALRAFEAAARHMSFAKAAKELFVTPAALSYQIKQLEEHLGVTVFRRLNRAVELTEEGAVLYPAVAEGFEHLRRGVRDLGRMQNDAVLTITAGPAFTAKWLAPRFFRFADAHPEFELRFVATLKTLDFNIDGVDAAIRYGPAPDERYYSEVLTREYLTPVCAPSRLDEFVPGGRIDTTHLLHDESMDFLLNPPNWQAWADLTGIDSDVSHGARFTNADHAIDVALEGGGVALGRMVLVARYLDHGRLVAPFPAAIEASAKYHFLCPKGQEDKPRIKALLAWIREEIDDVARHVSGREILTV